MHPLFECLEPRRLMSISLPAETAGALPVAAGLAYADTGEPPAASARLAAAVATADLAPQTLAGRSFTLKIVQSNGAYKPGGSYVIRFTGDNTWTATGGPGGADATVSGTYVWLKVNPQGGGLSFLSGSALGPFGGAFTFTTTTRGTFAFSGGYSAGVQSGTFTLDAMPISTKASISGNVFSDVNGNYSRGAGESGLAGRTVWLDEDNDGVQDPGERAVFTDAQGNYRFDNLDAGVYRVRTTVPAGQRLTAPGSMAHHPVTLLAGQAAEGRDFGLTNRAQISGIVFRDSAANGRRDPADTGLQGVRIYIDANNNGAYDPGENFTFTNADGHYFLSGPPTGTVRIRQVPPPGNTQTTPAAAHLVVTAPAARIFGRNFGNAVDPD